MDEALGAVEFRTCNAENDEGLLRDADGAANDVGIGGEVGVPGGVAEYGVGAAIGAMGVVAVMKEAAEQRRDAQCVEVAAGGFHVPARLRVAVGGECGFDEAIGADVGEATVVGAEVAVVGKGLADGGVLSPLNEGELAGLRKGGTEKEPVNDAEDDDVGGDPESQSEDGGGGETGTTAKLAQGVAEVGNESGHGVLSCGG